MNRPVVDLKKLTCVIYQPEHGKGFASQDALHRPIHETCAHIGPLVQETWN
jgi:hypothetical protein